MHMRSMEGGKNLYRLARQKDKSGKDVQHVKMIKDANGNVMTHEENTLKKEDRSILNN